MNDYESKSHVRSFLSRSPIVICFNVAGDSIIKPLLFSADLILDSNRINDISSLSGLTNLTDLAIDNNQIKDLSALSNLVNLRNVYLDRNQITDISPLMNNIGLGAGTTVYLRNNPLNDESKELHIPALEQRGANIVWDSQQSNQ